MKRRKVAVYILYAGLISASLVVLSLAPETVNASRFSEFGGSGRILLSEAGTLTFEVVVEERKFNVTVVGEGIDAAAFNLDKRALALNDSEHFSGPIEVQIPKELLGGNFTVFADDKEVRYEMSEAEDHSTLVIDRINDPEYIVIYGTSVVPEFYMTVAVLGPALASVLILVRMMTLPKLSKT